MMMQHCSLFYVGQPSHKFHFLGKIEMVKSKWGLALSAVVMVLASLCMSVAICFMFGMTPSLNGRYAITGHRV